MVMFQTISNNKRYRTDDKIQMYTLCAIAYYLARFEKRLHIFNSFYVMGFFTVSS